MKADTTQSDARQLPPTSRSLPILLIRARENVMAPIRRMLAETGITEQQWRVLRVLSESGPQDATKVAVSASLLLSSLTRIATTMREKGLITQVQDKSDRRRQKIAITPKGQRIIDDNREQALQVAAGFKARLGTENYERLLDLLQALSQDSED